VCRWVVMTSSVELAANPKVRTVPTRGAMWDLVWVVLFVWGSVLVIHALNIPEALAAWNADHEKWAIDEITLISITAVSAVGIFALRRWQESQRIIARHEATMERLAASEGLVAKKDHLINAVSHELRTPLTAMLGYAQLIGSEDTTSEDRRAMVDTILDQGWDLAHIVEDLLTRAQAESGSLNVAAVPVLLSAQASQVVETLNPHQGARLQVIDHLSIRAIADPGRVRQIIRNLVSNALRYGGPNITIATTAESTFATIEVSDDGPGVPAADRDRIFMPYQRLPVADQITGSIGLGLAVSRDLAQHMGGNLTYRRLRGQTIFNLSLPLATNTDDT